MYNDLEDTPLKKGDELVFISFGPSIHQLIVVNTEVIFHEEKLTEILLYATQVAKPLKGSELVKGQIVAARWTEDDKIYRAVINVVNMHLGQVKIRFIE